MRRASPYEDFTSSGASVLASRSLLSSEGRRIRLLQPIKKDRVMDLTPIIIVFIVFASIVSVIVGPSFLKNRERREMQLTVRHAVDNGQTLPPELIDAMTKDVEKGLPSRTKDIRKGVLSLAAGVGVGGFALVVQSATRDWGNGESALLGVACIPAAIGIAFIVLGFFNPNKA
jgi:hypothetical protein